MKVFEVVAAHEPVSYETSVLASEQEQRNDANKDPSVCANNPVFPHIGT